MSLLQGAVSRPQTIRERLSDLAWKQGVGSFFTEKVPFSYTTGTLFADRLVQVISAFLKQDLALTSQAVGLELGSGLGIFSRHLLEALKLNAPELYAQFQTVLTDYAPALVDSLEKSPLFAGHKDHVRCAVVDANSPVFPDGVHPHVVWISYLLDSLQTRHFEYENGVLYELYVQTKLKPDARLLDARHLPPTILEGEALATLFGTLTDADMQALGPMLGQTLEEHPVRVTLEESGLDAETIAHLRAFVATLNLPKEGVFRWNIPVSLRHMLTQLTQQCADQAMIVITDFGYHLAESQPEFAKLSTGYGFVTCHSVYFPYLNYVAKELGLSDWHTSYEEGQTQILILAKGQSHNACFETATRVFQEKGYDRIQSVANSVLALKEEPQKNTEKMWEIWDSLSPLEQQDYLIIMSFASACYDDGMYEDAIKMIERLPDTYDAVAAPAYVLLGKIYQKQTHFRKATFYYQLALTIYPGFPTVYAQLAVMALTEKKFEEYVSAITTFLTTCNEWQIWEQLVTLAIVQTKLGQTQVAKQICTWLIDAQATYPDLIPDTVKNKAQVLVQSYLK